MLEERNAEGQQQRAVKPQFPKVKNHGGWMVKASDVMAMVINQDHEVALETSLRNCAGSWDAFNLVRKSLSLIRKWLSVNIVPLVGLSSSSSIYFERKRVFR